MWCDLCGMKLNAGKTKAMIVSRSSTIHPNSSRLTLGRTVLMESANIVTLGVTFDAKIIFETHPRSVYFQSCSSVAWYHERVLASI